MHRIALCVALFLASGPAWAQFTQYAEPGSALDPIEESAESAEQEAQNARWRFGRLRLHPHLSLTDVGYVRNVFSATDDSRRVDDAHATLGAGLAGYLRLGSNNLVTGYVAPRYFWWQDSDELRELTLDSGIAWFGDFNRLQVSTIARDSENQRQLSSEVAAPVTISEEQLGFEATVALSDSIALFGKAVNVRTRHDQELEQFVPNLALRSLDRESSRRLLGVELRGAGFELGLGFERTEVDFLESDERDNSGSGPVLSFGFESGRLEASAEVSDLDFDFDAGTRPGAKRTIGSALIAFELRPRTRASVYLADRLSFTTFSTEGIIEFESRGLALQQSLGRRLEATLFGEVGRQAFDDPVNPGRVDDLDAYGLLMRFELTKVLSLTASVRDEEWTSTLALLDRSTSSVGFGIEVEGDLLPW